MSDVIYENEYYVIKTGISLHTTDTELPCYQIINREFNLVEAETTMLPSAIRNADEMSDALSEIFEDESVTEEAEVVTLQ